MKSPSDRDEQTALFVRAPSTASLSEREKQEAESALSSVLDSIRGRPDFPIGSDESITGLSFPPAYTACPNPWLGAGLQADTSPAGGPPEILTDDIRAGKNEAIYFAHFYPTKVPPLAIVPFILRYSQPGDVVLDAFCGTGMTGVAAQLCADDVVVGGRGQVGRRQALLVDLGAAPAFIAAITNVVGRMAPQLAAVQHIVEDVKRRHEGLLTTRHTGWARGTVATESRRNTERPASPRGYIEYVVWSDVIICSSCAAELVHWDLVFCGPGEAEAESARCTNCGAEIAFGRADRAWSTAIDPVLNSPIRTARQLPVLINYSVGTRRFEKIPDSDDLDAIARAVVQAAITPLPHVELPAGFNTAQPRASHGFTHVHHFFSPRNLVLLGECWRAIRAHTDPEVRWLGTYVITGAVQRVCRLNRYMPRHDRHVGPLSGTLYVAPLTAEIPATNYLLDRISDLRQCPQLFSGEGIRVSAQSATLLDNIPECSIDFVFTDPPFGSNLNYSELNILVEAWLGVRTNPALETIINETQRKGLFEYQRLLEQAFAEYYRVLKPGRYIVVEFHNTKNAVWKAIQEALWNAGFVIANVASMDKVKGTTKQLAYAATVKQDLVITAYKPAVGALPSRDRVGDGTAAQLWDFVRDHLRRLPTFLARDGRGEVMAERTAPVLFDRVVAFFVMRGLSVPISAPDFYLEARQRLPERDGMLFLDEQLPQYDRKRAASMELRQLTLFVSDEASAIQWVRQQLDTKPQTFQDLQPAFMRELRGWAKHERTVELKVILEQCLLRYDGQGPVPSQIHGYLSTNFKNLRSLAKDDPALVAKAMDRWYVPDPSKQADLDKLREKTLLKEFAEYAESKQRKLKQFRTEAIRAGFKAAYDSGDYKTIVSVAAKLPEAVLQEDEKLLMYYDVASMRLGVE